MEEILDKKMDHLDLLETPEMIEVQDLHLDENLVEIILDLASHEVINF